MIEQVSMTGEGTALPSLLPFIPQTPWTTWLFEKLSNLWCCKEIGKQEWRWESVG
jgi:hypothetical protein